MWIDLQPYLVWTCVVSYSLCTVYWCLIKGKRSICLVSLTHSNFSPAAAISQPDHWSVIFSRLVVNGRTCLKDLGSVYANFFNISGLMIRQRSERKMKLYYRLLSSFGQKENKGFKMMLWLLVIDTFPRKEMVLDMSCMLAYFGGCKIRLYPVAVRITRSTQRQSRLSRCAALQEWGILYQWQDLYRPIEMKWPAAKLWN